MKAAGPSLRRDGRIIKTTLVFSSRLLALGALATIRARGRRRLPFVARRLAATLAAATRGQAEGAHQRQRRDHPTHHAHDLPHFFDSERKRFRRRPSATDRQKGYN
jgi:hypothetical protein